MHHAVKFQLRLVLIFFMCLACFIDLLSYVRELAQDSCPSHCEGSIKAVRYDTVDPVNTVLDLFSVDLNFFSLDFYFDLLLHMTLKNGV